MSGNPSHESFPGVDFNATISLEDPDVSDDCLFAAVNEMFPDHLLPPLNRPVEQRSIGVDTSGLPPCCVHSITSRSDLVGTGDSNQSPRAPINESSPPSPIMTPPITPVESSDRIEGMLISGINLQNASAGNNAKSSELRVDCDSDDGLKTPPLSAMPLHRSVMWADQVKTPPRKQFQLPANGFSTPRLESRASYRTSESVIPPIPKMPTVGATGRVLRSSTRKITADVLKQPIATSTVIPRNLRRRPTSSKSHHACEPVENLVGVPESLELGDDGPINISQELHAGDSNLSSSNSKYIKTAKLEEHAVARSEVVASTKRKSTYRPKTAPKKRRPDLLVAKSKKTNTKKRKSSQKVKEIEVQNESDSTLKTKYQCNFCPKICRTAGSFKIHMEVVHLGIRYKCILCSKVESMMPSMGVHYRKMHPEKEIKRDKMKEHVIRFVDLKEGVKK